VLHRVPNRAGAKRDSIARDPLSEHAIDKVEHDPILVKWMLANKSDALGDIVELLRKALPGTATP
jgi:hypothetical protein